MKPGVEVIDDARSKLERTLESLVISYAHDDDTKTFLLVMDYPERAPDAQRAFIAFHFAEVRDFRRIAGNLAELQIFASHYSLTNERRPLVLQHIDSSPALSGLRLALSFGINYGEVVFAYQSVTGFVRQAHAEQRDGQWYYRDASSGQRLDFERPFADVLSTIENP